MSTNTNLRDQLIADREELGARFEGITVDPETDIIILEIKGDGGLVKISSEDGLQFEAGNLRSVLANIEHGLETSSFEVHRDNGNGEILKFGAPLGDSNFFGTIYS